MSREFRISQESRVRKSEDCGNGEGRRFAPGAKGLRPWGLGLAASAHWKGRTWEARWEK